MHDNAIQERTRLRLLEETQAQEQRQADAALAAETRRAAQQAELETGQAQQRAQLSMVSVKAQLAERRLQDEAPRTLSPRHSAGPPRRSSPPAAITRPAPCRRRSSGPTRGDRCARLGCPLRCWHL